MTEEVQQPDCRFFVSYSGVKLPFNLVNAIEQAALAHRNTFIRAYFDKAGLLRGFEKLVYGEIELTHRYEYHDTGALRCAEITMLDENPVTLHFDEAGMPVQSGVAEEGAPKMRRTADGMAAWSE